MCLRDTRGGKAEPEWAKRRRLLRARERLSDKRFARMWNAIIRRGRIRADPVGKDRQGEPRTLLSPFVPTAMRICPPSAAPFSYLVLLTHRSLSRWVWPPPSIPGGRRSTRSSPPASLMPAPRDTGARSSRSNAPRAGSATHKLGLADTLPLHWQTTGRDPELQLIARSNLKSCKAVAYRRKTQLLTLTQNYAEDWLNTTQKQQLANIKEPTR